MKPAERPETGDGGRREIERRLGPAADPDRRTGRAGRCSPPQASATAKASPATLIAMRPAACSPRSSIWSRNSAPNVNARDHEGNTAVHHAASRGDTEMIHYLVSKGADVKAVNREGQTTVDMANGPVQRVQPWPETIKYLESLGAKNNHKCLSC